MKYVKRALAEINLDNVEYNFRQIRNIIPSGAKLCCVVKADAYGHGAAELSHIYEKLGADFFAVSNLDEGMEIRNAGVTAPMLILGFTPPECAKALAKHNISQAVYSLDYARELARFARQAGVTCKVHIKLDTGMSRIGFMCQSFPRDDYSIDEIAQAHALEGLEFEGVFTHFAVADEQEAGKEFTNRQYESFSYTLSALEKRGISFKLRHCSNSGAIEDYPQLSLDMVRAGIIMYGYPPSDKLRGKLDLKPVMTLKSVISHVKAIEPETSVSYGRTFISRSPMKIATVPIGYADGYIRQYSDEGYMLVNGKKAKIVGRICMDQTMLDVTDIEDVKIGDEVIVFGDGSNGEPTANDLAHWSGTISYEVLCIIGKRVPRLFTRHGRITGVMYKL